MCTKGIRLKNIAIDVQNTQLYLFATALCTTPLDYLTVYYVNNNNY